MNSAHEEKISIWDESGPVSHQHHVLRLSPNCSSVPLSESSSDSLSIKSLAGIFLAVSHMSQRTEELVGDSPDHRRHLRHRDALWQAK